MSLSFASTAADIHQPNSQFGGLRLLLLRIKQLPWSALFAMIGTRFVSLQAASVNNQKPLTRVDLDSHQTILHVTSCLLLL
jgi:hypothetical protein